MHLVTRHIFTGFALILLSACSFANGRRAEVDLTKPVVLPTREIAETTPPRAPDIANGAKLYAQKCEACHGATGIGDGSQSAGIRAQGKTVANLPSVSNARTPSEWFDIISNGRIQNLMPGFSGSLSAQERWDVTAYALALNTSAKGVSEGKQIFEQNCATCHQVSAFANGTFWAQKSVQAILQSSIQGDKHANIKLSDVERLSAANFIRNTGEKYSDPQTLREAAKIGSGVIVYQVANPNASVLNLADTNVILHAYENTGEALSRTAKVDTSGYVTFTNLPTERGYFYEPEITLSGARFFGRTAQFTNTQKITSLIPVFSVTNDANVISISELHYFVNDMSESTMTLVEFYVFDNSSTSAYISAPRQSIKISLPPEATNLRFDGPGIGERFIRDGNALIDMDATPPGAKSSTITVIYDVPYKGKISLAREVLYPVKNWNALLPDSELKIANLKDQGTQAFNGNKLRIFTPQSPTVAQGGKIILDFVGQPTTRKVNGNDMTSIIAAGAALLCAALFGGFMILRNRAIKSEDIKRDKERRTLVRTIAALDDSYAQGKIKESAYLAQRNEQLAHLSEIWEH